MYSYLRFGSSRGADRSQVPAGEHARRRVDVRFLDVRDAEREQLHHLAREVLLRLGLGVQPSVEPHEHRRILGDGDQQVAEIPQREFPEQLELSLHAARRFTGLAGHHRARDPVAIGVVDLAVGRGEVVVPEERHLLLERPPRMDHPEQPPLPGVRDVGAGQELAARGDADVTGLADLGSPRRRGLARSSGGCRSRRRDPVPHTGRLRPGCRRSRLAGADAQSVVHVVPWWWSVGSLPRPHVCRGVIQDSALHAAKSRPSSLARLCGFQTPNRVGINHGWTTDSGQKLQIRAGRSASVPRGGRTEASGSSLREGVNIT